MLKYWWIASAISVLLSIVGGICVRTTASERDFPLVVRVFSVIAMIIAIIGVTVFIVFSVIMIYTRFYKNFFTDEGYLTFTLPVTRAQLLNSKILSGLVIELLTGLVFIIDFLLIFGIGFYELIFTEEFTKIIQEFFFGMWNDLGGFTIAYVIELILISILTVVASITFTFICITLASIITRKAKVLLAVVIYYVFNSITSSVIQTLSFLGTPFIEWIGNVPQSQIRIVVPLGLATFILIIACICLIMYSIEYRMIDKKLNLS